MTLPRTIGVVRYFNHRRRYGFIDAGFGKDIFFHAIEIEDGEPQPGARVEFVLGDRRGRECAQHVRIL
jgi:cold shock CspA family protein